MTKETINRVGGGEHSDTHSLWTPMIGNPYPFPAGWGLKDSTASPVDIRKNPALLSGLLSVFIAICVSAGRCTLLRV